MSVNGCVAGGGQILVLTIGDMKVGLGLPVLLRKTKVNNIIPLPRIALGPTRLNLDTFKSIDRRGPKRLTGIHGDVL
jgi:hypothetical protein